MQNTSKLTALQMGAGEVVAVETAVMDLYVGEQLALTDIRGASVCLASLLESGSTACAAKRLACAVLNSDFYASGRLFICDVNGKVSVAYFVGKDERTIATLGMFPDQLKD